MTTPETTAPSAHPYRAAARPCALDCDGRSLPYTGQTRMRLTLSSGLADALIVIDPAAEDLIAIHCDGLEPRLRVAPGELSVSWRQSFGDWLRDVLRPADRGVSIVLHPAVEWTLAIRGGLAHCELALAAGKLARLDVHGGCSEVQLELPAPATAVPIRISGGASRLVVQRPAEIGVALTASGGLASLSLDDQHFDAIGGSARLETRNLAAGAPRYDLQLSGGAADLAIEPRAC